MANPGCAKHPGRRSGSFHHWISNQMDDISFLVSVSLPNAAKYLAQFHFGSVFSLSVILCHVFTLRSSLECSGVACQKGTDTSIGRLGRDHCFEMLGLLDILGCRRWQIHGSIARMDVQRQTPPSLGYLYSTHYCSKIYVCLVRARRTKGIDSDGSLGGIVGSTHSHAGKFSRNERDSSHCSRFDLPIALWNCSLYE